jgi:FkbM family methyltransferase
MPETAKPPLLNRLALSRPQLLGARCLYRTVKLFARDDRRQITRGGIHHDVDLSEGIDLSLFLFGGFQSHVTDTRYYTLAHDAVIFDVGANIGTMCLSFAKHASEGVVYAFEPTEYAYKKLLGNISLNPDLAPRIHPTRAYVSHRSQEALAVSAYSSWKVDGKVAEAHPVHGGAIRPAEVTRVLTLDEFARDHAIERIDLIKTDTDGHELEVLEGAVETLRRCRPVVIFEIGDYAGRMIVVAEFPPTAPAAEIAAGLGPCLIHDSS